MKRLLTILLLMLAVSARGATIFPITSTSDFIGSFPTNYNQSISNLNAAIGGSDLVGLSNGVINVGLKASNAVCAVSNSVVEVSSSTNYINIISNQFIGCTQWFYFVRCFTNVAAAGSGATQAIATVGSSTVTSTINGATLSWSNSVTGGGSSNPGFTDYFHAQLNAAGAAAWTITAGTWLTGKYNVVRSNAQGVWKTNSYSWIYTSTGLVFAAFHIQPYHAAGYRYAVLYRNGVPYLGVSEDFDGASGQYFDIGGVVIWENDAATNEYSAVFFAEAIGYSAALSDGQTNLEYITGGRFQ